jgi:hypothetical protein
VDGSLSSVRNGATSHPDASPNWKPFRGGAGLCLRTSGASGARWPLSRWTRDSRNSTRVFEFCSGLVDLVVCVGRHLGGGHCFTRAGERFVGRVAEDIAKVDDRCAEFGRARCGYGMDGCEPGDRGRRFNASSATSCPNNQPSAEGSRKGGTSTRSQVAARPGSVSCFPACSRSWSPPVRRCGTTAICPESVFVSAARCVCGGAAWLHSACRMTDQAAILQAELVGAPRMVRGSQGQSVANPLLGELRQLHLAINQTLARIKTDVPEASL